MKKLIAIIVAISISVGISAQTPQLMSYQAVIRNSSNQLVANAPVGMRVSILQGSASGSAVYIESHTPTTNGNGLAMISVGGGTSISGNFASINWANGPFFIKSETDLSGGSNYTITATSQLLSVPYALHAATAANGVPAGGQPGEYLTNCNAVLSWTEGGECPGSIAELKCNEVTHSGEMVSGVEAVGVSSSIPYVGGTGGVQIAKQFFSTGVAGLTATINAGFYASGNGTINCIISGRPIGAGTANFLIKINGKTCSLSRNVVPDYYPPNTVHCVERTAIVDITNPNTGRTWMDRNLGASQAATSIFDEKSYGDLYQWGRPSDGHQCRNSQTINTPSSTAVPPHGSFINGGSWTTSGLAELWDLYSDKNNPCPEGYHVPTNAEWQSEMATWAVGGLDGLRASVLKLPAAGYRSGSSILDVGEGANYWTNELSYSGWNFQYVKFISAYDRTSNYNFSPSQGLSVRCIKDISGAVSSINCDDVETSDLYLGTNNNQLSLYTNVKVSYTGGNGGIYKSYSVASTGVTGLTATVVPGYFTNGAGQITYRISGEPSFRGKANFLLKIGGKECTFSINIPADFPAGRQQCNTYSSYLEVRNPSTGKVWLDRNLGAYSISNVDNSGDLYQWGRWTDGHQCRNVTSYTYIPSSVDRPNHNSIILGNNNDWRSPKNDNLWQGVIGVNNPCPIGFRVPSISEWDEERASWSTNTQLGAYASPLKLPTISLGWGSGSGDYWSSSVDGNDAKYFYFYDNDAGISSAGRATRKAVRCIKEDAVQGMISDLNCESATVSGSLFSGSEAVNVKVEIPYEGGNGINFAGTSINSTEVSGLTALLESDFLAVGSGSLKFQIKGTPLTGGGAKFLLNIAGKSCTFSLPVVQTKFPQGTVHCKITPTAIVDVVNPATGRIWMDRNLGAIQVAQSPSDSNSYGDLFQWGRRADGHQCRKSATTTEVSSSSNPGHSKFISVPYYGGNYNYYTDWCKPQDHELWQINTGKNNPCPSGYRVPTSAEWTAESSTWDMNNSEPAFTSMLKLPKGGIRSTSISSTGSEGYYWSSTKFGGNSNFIIFGLGYLYSGNFDRMRGLSVRCIKD